MQGGVGPLPLPYAFATDVLHCPFESLSQRLNLTQLDIAEATGSEGSRNSPRPRRMTSDYQTAANL